jgi:hypothetical protein
MTTRNRPIHLKFNAIRPKFIRYRQFNLKTNIKEDNGESLNRLNFTPEIPIYIHTIMTVPAATTAAVLTGIAFLVSFFIDIVAVTYAVTLGPVATDAQDSIADGWNVSLHAESLIVLPKITVNFLIVYLVARDVNFVLIHVMAHVLTPYHA